MQVVNVAAIFRRVVLSGSALLLVCVVLSTAWFAYEGRAGAVSPNLELTGSHGADGAMLLTMSAANGAWDPYVGFTVQLRWNPAVFHFSGFNASGGSFESGSCDGAQQDVDGGGVTLSCAALEGSPASSGGLWGVASFSVVSPGCSTFDVVPFSPSADGDWLGSYTVSTAVVPSAVSASNTAFDDAGLPCNPAPTATASATPTAVPVPSPTPLIGASAYGLILRCVPATQSIYPCGTNPGTGSVLVDVQAYSQDVSAIAVGNFDFKLISPASLSPSEPGFQNGAGDALLCTPHAIDEGWGTFAASQSCSVGGAGGLILNPGSLIDLGQVAYSSTGSQATASLTDAELFDEAGNVLVSCRGPQVFGRCDGLEADTDGDSVTNAFDNCPISPNPSQLNTDAGNVGINRPGTDGLGDVCDNEIAGDGYTNAQHVSLGKDPTRYCATMRADVDGDGIVSILDLADVAQYFTAHVPTASERYSQDGDNVISVLDLADMGSVFTENVSACP